MWNAVKCKTVPGMTRRHEAVWLVEIQWMYHQASEELYALVRCWVDVSDYQRPTQGTGSADSRPLTTSSSFVYTQWSTNRTHRRVYMLQGDQMIIMKFHECTSKCWEW